MTRILHTLVVAGVVAGAAACAASPPPDTLAADLVLRGGKVFTADAAGTIHEALAVREGRIVAAGSDRAVERFIGPETRVIDLDGKLVTPGFNDAHIHFAPGGSRRSSGGSRRRLPRPSRANGSWGAGGTTLASRRTNSAPEAGRRRRSSTAPRRTTPSTCGASTATPGGQTPARSKSRASPCGRRTRRAVRSSVTIAVSRRGSSRRAPRGWSSG